MSLVGMWLYGRKSLWGPLIGILDTVPWVLIAWLTHTYYVLAFDVALAALSLRTLILWRRD